MPLQRLATVAALKQRGTIKLIYRDEGIAREGFLAWHEGQVLAYENVCRHVPISLDYGDGVFFTSDQKYIRCQTHGAIYEPLTGRCIAGPCPGTYLKPLPILVDHENIYIEQP